MKRIAVLGATGSIGLQTLDVVRRLPDRLQVVGLAAHRNAEQLRSLASEFGVSHLCLGDGEQAARAGLPGGVNALCDLARLPEADLVVISVAGVIGLQPTLAAIEAGKEIALASKEVLVAAGELVMPLVRERGLNLTPIDSEHSALFQCLGGYRSDQVDSLVLTASGGPFRGRSRASLEGVTVAQALDHPTWKMGGKITIDSATLMNKALETIEARWLFDVPMEKIEAVIHPQSIVHSLVRFKDQSVLGQLGWPDMRLPIQVALLWPERVDGKLPLWNPVETPNLTFEPIDHEAFPALHIARRAMAMGGTAACVFNAANEEAVAQFLAGKLGFLEISALVSHTLDLHTPEPVSLESLLRSDLWARETIRRVQSLKSE